MESAELIKKYIEFFKSKGHVELPSAPLIPEHDPSVLFTTAGMHPLVPYLMGQKHPKGKRLVDVQKCIRTQDIDEVGDEIHTTCFEMLGNWSLGDYFKKEAIEFSFEFLTKVLKLPLNRISVTCFVGDENAPKDTEASLIWLGLGVKKERIAFLPKKDNWWGPAGETGPCGPDTEMFYWTPNNILPPEVFDPKDKRWVEIWNDVFMQYNKTKDGKYIPLQNKCVDTGLGVERVTMALQGKTNIFEIETFKPIIDKVIQISRKNMDNTNISSFRVISDHIKAATFILGDERGVVPGNVDQGYILRRYIRRTIRHLRLLGVDLTSHNATSELACVVIDIYKKRYPCLEQKRSFICGELNKEEERFIKTLDNGIKEFEKISKSVKIISGKDAFLLYQSYGFPIEMIKELAFEKNLSVDTAEFNKEYEKHQELSRLGAEQKFKGGLSDSSVETTKLHTATHLLGEALRRVLHNPDIKQKGSNITPERLRYDFNFERKLTPEEIKKVEDTVNAEIKKGLEVKRLELSFEDAKKLGAQAEFEGKYSDIVSVYKIGDFSLEVCGGPHVNNISELKHFKILKEESSAAGIRRIKAVLD